MSRTRTMVIAEPGCTAEGELDRMVDLIHTAAEAGADCYKAQWTSSPERMCERRHAPDYLRFYRWLAFPKEWHEQLASHCLAVGLQYACSIYLPEDAALVAPFVSFLKISSFEAGDVQLRASARNTLKRVIVSDGMAERPWMVERNDMLLCTSAYPAPLDEMQLGAIRDKRYSGLSDHSRHVLTGAVAVGAGATIIEAHLRLSDCDRQNPDYAVAFSPTAFDEYVQNIRLAEALMGDGVKRVQPCEAPMLKYRVTA